MASSGSPTLASTKRAARLKSRRLFWFFKAALVKRATDIASRTPLLQPDVAAIWIMIARGCAHLPELLEDNQLWSKQEKQHFSVIRTEKDGVSYALHLLAQPT
jgi:hypothetical protein